MSAHEPLLPSHKHVPSVSSETPACGAAGTVATRDHALIRRWADRHQAQPATGEATASGPASVDVHDGAVNIRFNFPGAGRYRPIGWDEWFETFDSRGWVFVFEGPVETADARYRIVSGDEWSDVIE